MPRSNCRRCSSSHAGRPRATLFHQFLQPDIPDQAEPEGLHEVKNRALFAVEKTEPKEIAVEKVAERTEIQRKAHEILFQPQDPLVGRAEELGLLLPVEAVLSPLQLFIGEHVRVTDMLLEVEQDVVLLQV